jgi:hypothetical protein
VISVGPRVDSSDVLPTEQVTSANSKQLDANVSCPLTKEELSRRNTFFQCRGLYDDMFRILAETGKSGTIYKAK